MEQQNKELLGQVQEFKDIFKEYYKALMEYLRGKISSESEYEFSHPTLFSLSNKLQVAYLRLPEILQTRLRDIEFDVFLHCNNLVDFYEFRAFLIEEQRFQGTATIVERVDSEINLAKLIIESDIWEDYSKLPNRNFHFYRGYHSQPKMMDELRLEFEKDVDIQQQKHESLEKIENWSGDSLEKNSEDSYNDEDNFYKNVMEKVGKTEKLVGSANSIVGKTISLMTSLGKLFI